MQRSDVETAVRLQLWGSPDQHVVLSPREYELLREELEIQPARVKDSNGAKR